MKTPKRPLGLFYCYAHPDRGLCEELNAHLASLKHKNVVKLWYDRKIFPGTDWEKDIDKHLSTADIILLLISSDFLNSQYCYGIEMEHALKLHEEKMARVIPILVRSVHWKDTPFSKLQLLPTGAKPVTLWQNRDEAWSDVVEGISSAIQEIQEYLEKAQHEVSSFLHQQSDHTELDKSNINNEMELPKADHTGADSGLVLVAGTVVSDGIQDGQENVGSTTQTINIDDDALLRSDDIPLERKSDDTLSTTVPVDDKIVDEELQYACSAGMPKIIALGTPFATRSKRRNITPVPSMPLEHQLPLSNHRRDVKKLDGARLLSEARRVAIFSRGTRVTHTPARLLPIHNIHTTHSAPPNSRTGHLWFSMFMLALITIFLIHVVTTPTKPDLTKFVGGQSFFIRIHRSYPTISITPDNRIISNSYIVTGTEGTPDPKNQTIKAHSLNSTFSQVFLTKATGHSKTVGKNPQNYVFVTKDDINRIVSPQLQQQIVQKAAKQLIEQMNTGEKLAENPQCTMEMNSSAPVGDTGKLVESTNVTVTASCISTAYDDKAMRDLVTDLLEQKAQKMLKVDYMLQYDHVIIEPKIQSVRPTLSLVATAQGQWVYEFDEMQKQALLTKIKGFPVNTARTILSGQEGVKRSNIQYDEDTLPNNLDHIDIIIETPTSLEDANGSGPNTSPTVTSSTPVNYSPSGSGT